MKNIAFLLCILNLFISCQEDMGTHIERLVQEWQGKEIRFPEKLTFTRYVNDTIEYYIPKSKNKIVTYVDSIGCISCKLQLPKWKEFIRLVDSVTNKTVPILFFFQPKDNDELRYYLQRDSFSFPVCIDTQHRFNSLNHFPSEMMFQTFLLDKDNKVVVIGNPIHNLAVRDLYLKEIAGIENVKLPETTLVTDQEEYDMGTVGENETKAQQVLIRNNGTEIFKLKGITTSCECTTTEQDWEEIAPGETATLTVYYKAEEPGDFYRTVTIYGNIPGESLMLSFVGKVQ